MSELIKLADGRLALVIDTDRQEVTLSVTSDGEAFVVSAHTSEEGDEQPEHSKLLRGLAQAMIEPELQWELKALAERGFALFEYESQEAASAEKASGLQLLH